MIDCDDFLTVIDFVRRKYMLITFWVFKCFKVVFFLVTGTFHPRHAATLHLQSAWNDSMGERDLWSIEAARDFVSWRTRSSVGAWSITSVPRQVRIMCILYGKGMFLLLRLLVSKLLVLNGWVVVDCRCERVNSFIDYWKLIETTVCLLLQAGWRWRA